MALSTLIDTNAAALVSIVLQLVGLSSFGAVGILPFLGRRRKSILLVAKILNLLALNVKKLHLDEGTS